VMADIVRLTEKVLYPIPMSSWSSAAAALASSY
jgi:hypothetical protein